VTPRGTPTTESDCDHMWHGEQLLIDGKLVDAEDGRSYSTLDPSTGDELGTCADATLADGERHSMRGRGSRTATSGSGACASSTTR
jgi:hypothetical protein